MPLFDIDLEDGRTIEVEAANINEAIQKQAQINKINARGTAEAGAAMRPEQVSGMDAFLLGAGRETDKLIQGTRHLFADPSTQAMIDQQQARNDQAFAPVEESHPWATMAGGVLPYMATPTAGFLPSMLMGGATGYARHGTDDERSMNAGMDMALTALPFGIGKANRMMGGGVPPATNMVNRARRAGHKLTPGEMTGSKSLQTLEGAIQSTPMIFNPMHRISGANQDLLNRTAASSMGLHNMPKGFKLTDDVVGDSAERLTGKFRALQDVPDMPADAEFLNRMVDVDQGVTKRLFGDPDVTKTVDKVLDRFDDSGKLKASDYQDMSSELKAKIRSAWKGESPDAFYAESLSDIVDSLDKLAENNMSGKALDELRTARNQWKTLKALENSRSLRESGDVSGKLLANHLKRTDKAGYGRGKNRSRLYELARASKAFPGMADSGTAGRSFLQQMAQNPVAGVTGLAMSPVTSLASNAYMAGVPMMLRAAGHAPTMASPGMTGRMLAALLNPEDEDM